MTPNEFVSNAIRTESRIETVVVNQRILERAIEGIIALSEILDQIKKHAFYKKPFDITKINAAILNAKYAVEFIERHTMQSSYAMFPMPQGQTELTVNPRLFHAIIGIATESAELLEALDLSSNKFDRVNILEELGDVNWYQAIAVDELNADLEADVLDRVIAKLRARYPEKFTSENAINRDLVREREVLEGKSE